jgi:hypothetical protein
VDRSTAWGKNARVDMRLVMAWSTGFTAFAVFTIFAGLVFIVIT